LERTCEAYSFVSCADKSESDPTGLTQVFRSSNATDARGEKTDAQRRNKPPAFTITTGKSILRNTRQF
jgi:hypothetical protein